MFKARKIGFVFKPEGTLDWWRSHAMAPAPILRKDGTVRVYMGCWTEDKISRIGYVDVLADRPTEVINISKAPVLDIGRDGCFDENGVFPAHAYRFDDGRVYLYYTGFQLGHKIRPQMHVWLGDVFDLSRKRPKFPSNRSFHSCINVWRQ